MRAVATEGLTKDFGDLRAVDDLSLSVEPGEIFGYLGPNGAGKTTTIRLLLAFLRPTTGTTSVLGGSGEDPEIRGRIGYLPADLHIDPAYSTRDVVTFFGRLRGGVETVEVDDLCERFVLDPTRPVGELSTGNRRKVGIVQAFMHRPDLLVLDEPTSGLDPLLQVEFHRLVRERAEAGSTVFLSSHVLPEVEGLCERVGILRQGRLVALSTVDGLRAQVRQRIDLHLAPGQRTDGFGRVPGVVEVTASGDTVSVVVEGSVDAVLKRAATHTVERVVTHESDLEDVFLRYYEDGAS